MASELEGLIAGLLVRVSCAGEEGCSVTDVLEAVRHPCGTYQQKRDNSEQGTKLDGEDSALHHRTASTIWQWLAARRDVSVGSNRKYNNLTLDQVLDISPPVESPAEEEANNDAASGPKPHHVRVYASEETMWESLTGHAVDYKRVPRSEWLLLLGIASTTSEGILQGDLGRLVDQDKRSVPKRTDALLRKGYIAKRTTLVRGTKTSKMWLKLFAPPLPKDGESTADEPRADMNITRQVLVANLDPVPWHIRWTGESVDYTALATTIMAVAKEWGVLRMQDLKAKLGVLGMRWQMKVLAKVCRFLNARGVIQYVAAKLGDKVFKDCIKYGRDLNAEDWSVYLATGKRTTKKPTRTAELGAGEGDDAIDPLLSQSTNVSEVSSAPPWSLDKPLPATIVKMTHRFGDTGLTNPDVYGLTLGPSFSRYLSSMTTAISTANLQPLNLQYLQLRSEHTRTGKVASYRYFAQHPVSTLHEISKANPATETQRNKTEGVDRSSYGFAPVSALMVAPKTSTTLTELCESRMAKRKRKAHLKKTKITQVDETPQDEVHHGDETQTQTPKEPKKRGRPKLHPELPETKTLKITMRVSSEKLKALIGEDIDQTKLTGSPRPRRTRRSTVQAADIDMTDSLVQTGEDADVLEDTSAVPRKRGRGRRPADSNSALRPWKCEKCGGSWKNDIGLKYHLEKSRTPCNPTFDKSEPTPRRGRKRASPEPTNSAIGSPAPSTLSIHTILPETSAIKGHRDVDSRNKDASPSAPDRGPSENRVKNKENFLSRLPINLSGSPIQAAPDWRRPPVTSFDTPRDGLLSTNNGGALVESEDSQPRPVLALSDLSNLESASGKPGRSKQKTQSKQSTTGVVLPDTRNTCAVKPVESYASPQLDDNNKDNQDTFGAETVPAPDTASEAGVNDKEKFKFIHEPLKELLGEQAAEKNSESQALFGNGLSRSMLNRRISEIIIELLAEQNGIFPGGKCLWHAITTTWIEKYPTDPAPTVKACQAGLKEVLRKKAAAEHWHAFRDDRGMFSKCQIIIQPTLDPFSPDAMSLVDKIKQAYPQLYMPQPFTAPPDPMVGKDFRRGRRNLASEVEVLNAPVYAAQATAKKRPDDTEDDAPPTKRLKRKLKEADPGSPPGGRQKSTQVKWVAEAQSDHIARQIWPKPFGSISLKKPAKGFQFLAPNTYLEEDPPNRFYKSRSGPKRGSPNKTSQHNQYSFPEALSGDAVFGSTVCIPGFSGSWPYLDMQYFESQDVGYTLSGWMPDSVWFTWATIVQEIEKRTTALSGRKRRKRTGKGSHQMFINSIVACMDLEESWADAFIGAPRKAAGPHNVFIRLFGGPNNHVSIPSTLNWPQDGQLTPGSMHVPAGDSGDVSAMPLSDDDDGDDELFDWAEDPNTQTNPDPTERGVKDTTAQVDHTQPAKPKRVALISRTLMSLPADKGKSKEVQDPAASLNTVDEPDRLLAGFVAVRILLGGSDKAIDWGLLLRLFPNIGLATLRRFWLNARKQQGAFIAKLTKDFQDKFLAAYEREELPEIDFEDPLDYDWNALIDWTLQLNRKDDIQLPSTRNLLEDTFFSKDAPRPDEDWQEKFFHAQASVFSRFEWATATPGAISLDEIHHELHESMYVTDLDVAKSWVRSLCCTDETQYSIQQIKDKFSTLAMGDSSRNNMLLTQAIEQLTQQRIITKIRKPLYGGRPYRLNEWFTYMVGKLGQQAKFQEAATFKTNLDAAFRRGGTVKVPYTLDDGSVMALTNLNAAGRIRLVPVNVPYIPFGFEPGNYESRKFPKSYYYFGMEAAPTETYLYSEDIDVLQLADQEGPPLGSSQGELPQWVDFFGKRNVQRWMEVLGAFCFVYATRGFTTIEGICTALKPILEEYEARIIVDWGKRTGVLKDSEDGLGTTVGEWWWLAVPWLSRSGQTGRVRAIDE